VAAGSENPVEVLPGEVNGLIVIVAEVIREAVAVSAVARRTSDQPSASRTPHHVQVLM